MNLKVLFIGGTGIISSAVSALAVKRGIQLSLLNRGLSKRNIPKGVEMLTADLRDRNAVNNALGGRTFDAVVNWIAFTPDQIEADLQYFKNRTAQYIFISSASVYHTPPLSLPVTESTPLHNPFWEYSRQKIACEERLMQAYREDSFPATIVRPSHTYDATLLPMHSHYTVVARMRAGKKVIVHGDGTSLWTMTHHRDFAKGFIGLLGNPGAVGEAYHITSDEVLTWDQIFRFVGNAAGVEPKIVHIPSEMIAAFDPEWGASLLGDKAHSMIFDNSKIKRLVPEFQAKIPFWQGAKEVIEWFGADPDRQIINQDKDRTMDRIIAAYQAGLPGSDQPE